MELQNPAFLILISLFILVHRVSSERSTYIVHMDKSSMPKAFSAHHFWYSSLLKSARSVSQTSLHTDKKSEPKLIYTYDHAFHGFSAVMSRDELQTLKKSSGFIYAYADHVATRDTTHSTKFLALNTAAGIWPASQYGKDVIIGIIDSGIWPESRSFNDDGMTAVPAGWKGICEEGQEFNSSLCNKKLIGARYFNEGERAADPNFLPTMNSARDVDGHGTHLASIAAGNFVDGVSFFGYAPGTARGVAPRARIAAYKVGSYDSDVLAGIDQAVADGVHIINIARNFAALPLANPIAAATFGARAKGVVVCMSAGNRGPSIATVQAGIPWAVVVASGTVDRWFAGTITLGHGKTITGWTTFPARASIRNLQLLYNQTLSACNSTELLREYSPFGSVIICDLTPLTLDFSDLMDLVSTSGAQAVIVISEDTSILRSSSFRFPGTVITPTESVEVIEYASNTATPTVTIEFLQTIIGAGPRPAPALSGSSSRGPALSYEGIMKPDIMAPGVLILAATNPNGARSVPGQRIVNTFLSSDYTLLSGTSMAAPHIAGVAALLKAARPEWSAAAIQSAMMTTANHLDSTKQPIKDMGFDTYRVASPLGIGSGMVDPNRALHPGLIYDATPQDFVNLVCSTNLSREETQSIIRSSYNCSSPSSDLNYPSFIALFSSEQRGMTFTKTFKRTVTNVGDGAATYRVKFEQPANTTVRIWPETLVFRKKNEKRRYSLSIRYRGDIELSYSPQGSLTWVEDSGKYAVRSPIVVSAGVDNFG